MAIAPERAEQPTTQAESSPPEAPEKSFREIALERLRAERGDAPQESETEQPEAAAYTEESSEDVVGDGTEAEIDDIELTEESEEEEPEVATIEAIEVEGHQFTAQEIKELLDSHDQAVEARKEYDADYRRKTQSMARIRQEYEAHGEEIGQVSNFFVGLAQANVQKLEAMDPAQMSQEEFASWRQQLAQAQQGRDQLMGMIQKAGETVKQRREKQLDDAAAESAVILEGIDKRWNNEFYGKIRDWAVKTERYSAKEFADVVDWRTMEGLIALYDRDQAQTKITKTTETNDPPQRDSSSRAGRRPNRGADGKFRSAEAQVMESKNARADGSMRSYFQQKLARERRGR